MSNGHTPVKEQGALPYDFVETPSKYDDPDSSRPFFNDSDSNDPNLDSNIFDGPETEPEPPQADDFSDRHLGSTALGQSHSANTPEQSYSATTLDQSRPTAIPSQSRPYATSDQPPRPAPVSRLSTNQFHAPNPDDMPTPVDFDSGIANLPIPGATPDAATNLSIPGATPDTIANLPIPGATPDATTHLPTPGVLPDAGEVAPPPENFNQSLPESLNSPLPENSNQSLSEDLNLPPPENLNSPLPESLNQPLTVTLERPLEAPRRGRLNRRKRNTNGGQTSKLSALNPLSPPKVDETKFQAEKGHLGGAARKELATAEHALNRGDLEVALRAIRNAMAGYTGEYEDRDESDFKNRMWKDNPEPVKEES